MKQGPGDTKIIEPPASSEATPGETEPPAALLVSEHGKCERQVLVASGSMRIGRDSGADVVVEDEAVSRMHAEVLHQGAEFSLQDLGSTNGTYLNGRRIPPHRCSPLSDGDHVIIGGAVIRFRRLVGRPSTRSKLDSKAGSEGVGPQADLYSLFRLARIQAFLIASGPSPRRFPVNSDRVRVGRHLDCDIVLDHSSVSDHHAEIVYTNEGFHVVDRDSALGTFVAGVAVRVARLYHRAYLRLGKEKGLFVMRQMEREPPEPSFQLRDQLSEAFPERAPLIQQTFKDSRQEALDFAEQLVLRGVLDAEEWWAATRDCEGTRELARRWQPWAVLRWRRRRS